MGLSSSSAAAVRFQRFWTLGHISHLAWFFPHNDSNNAEHVRVIPDSPEEEESTELLRGPPRLEFRTDCGFVVLSFMTILHMSV
jgi:hypothetical protein